MTLALTLVLAAATPNVLIIGGGPNKEYNQVAIESNVRYMHRMLPSAITPRTLFADGDRTTATVRYTPPGQQPGKGDLYRATTIDRVDGATTLNTVQTELARAIGDGRKPVFLYLTGHGSLARNTPAMTSQFDLWGPNPLTAPVLAEALKAARPDTPVALFMVQCHSGGFANLLFEGGDAKAPLANNRVFGFFASVAPRLAAGCTPNVNEADYHDFTGYFLAALTGTDRMGRPVRGADYDGNGWVGMNEAFCWSLVNDDSVDTPVCTSDEFLRRFVVRPDADVFATSYSDVLKWASPPQRAALEALSKSLNYAGEDRLKGAYTRFMNYDERRETRSDILNFRYVRLAKSVILAHDVPKLDEPVRKRYAQLIKDEASNPLRP